MQAEPAERRERKNRTERGLLKLLIAFSGRSPALDKKLKEVAVLLRSGKSDAGFYDRLEDCIDDAARELRSEPGGTNAVPAVALLDALDRDLSVSDLAHQTAARLRATLAARANVSNWLEEAKQLGAQIRKDIESGDGEPAALDATKHHLRSVIDQMPIDTGAKQSINAAVSRANDLDALDDPISVAIAKLHEAKDRGDQEYQNLVRFVGNTRSRLQQIETIMNRSGEVHAATSADVTQLSETVTLHISELRESVSDADDIESIKNDLNHSLDRIDQGINEFSVAQHSRQSEAASTIESMVNKLRSLENVAETLRDDLEQKRQLSLVDPLTRVFNRRGYDEMVRKHYARWQRHGGTLSLALIDLDHFKLVNDNYGHTAGDRVLKTVAEKIRDGIRTSDVLARYGGEEFVLLLPETAAAEAVTLVDKLRENVQSCTFKHKDTPVEITFSAGIAAFGPQSDIESVFERADRAMYEAKQSGRNQVVVGDFDSETAV
ncbi:MAG: diguanylate cyclase [Pseudomonadota bacterium]